MEAIINYMAQSSWSDEHESNTDSDVQSASRIPTRYLNNRTPTGPHGRNSGLSGSFTRVPPSALVPQPDEVHFEDPELIAHRAILRRRRLLSVFGRMMARFYNQHQRHWSLGQRECHLCKQRIIGWCWSPQPTATHYMHEECISRSMWDIVIYYEQLARAGYAQDINSLNFDSLHL